MEDTTKIIAVVRGASNAEIQVIFRELADKWRRDVRLVGLVVENHGLADRHCQASYLRNLTTGARFSIFHDLGPGAAMCHLDGIGAVAAAAGVQSDIEAGTTKRGGSLWIRSLLSFPRTQPRSICGVTRSRLKSDVVLASNS